jgi:4-hydroxy-3-methylbut-2-enyl diphosphate reductase
MRIEARAIRRGLRGSSNPPVVLRTGYGTTRAAKRAGEISHRSFGQMAIMGVGGGLTNDLSPGDLVVGTEVGAVTCASAPMLAGELRRTGLPARTGRITTVDHLVRRSERARMAADGTLLADMESAPLATAAGGRPVAVIRAVSDTPADRAAVAARRRARRRAVGRGVRHPPAAAGRAAVVLRRRRAGD